MGSDSEHTCEIQGCLGTMGTYFGLLLDGVESEGDGSVSMDPAVWSWLPHEILEKMLTLLPLRQLLRFRAVCKSWLHLLSDARFLDEWSGLSAPPPCMVMLNEQEGKAGPLSLPEPVREIKWGLPYLPVDGLYPCSAAGGLLCLARWKEDVLCNIQQPFYICNPITRRFKQLPDLELPDTFNVLFATLFVYSDSYKLFVGCGTIDWTIVQTPRLHAYDSRTSSWTYVESVPARYVDGVAARQMVLPEHIRRQLVEDAYCSCILSRRTSYWRGHFGLVKHQGCLYRVRRSRSKPRLRIYEIDLWTMRRHKIAELGEGEMKTMLGEWGNTSWSNQKVVSSRDLICSSFIILGPLSTKVKHVVCYHVALKKWQGWCVPFQDKWTTKWNGDCQPYHFDLSSRHLV